MVLHHRPEQPFPVGDPSPCTFAEPSLDSSIARSCLCSSPCGGLQRAMPFQVVKEDLHHQPAGKLSSCRQTSQGEREREALWSFKLHLYSDLYHIYVCMDKGSLCLVHGMTSGKWLKTVLLKGWPSTHGTYIASEGPCPQVCTPSCLWRRGRPACATSIAPCSSLLDLSARV